MADLYSFLFENIFVLLFLLSFTIFFTQIPFTRISLIGMVIMIYILSMIFMSIYSVHFKIFGYIFIPLGIVISCVYYSMNLLSHMWYKYILILFPISILVLYNLYKIINYIVDIDGRFGIY